MHAGKLSEGRWGGQVEALLCCQAQLQHHYRYSINSEIFPDFSFSLASSASIDFVSWLCIFFSPLPIPTRDASAKL
ncbi:hypothetical protein E2C01_035806 [Portunus trituberculatus]|uniref:Uncharacterized protein n=1 Tax=Portunus trituberculatus TaxID=210409 RepID=A0A5B7F5A0_PORTR|nr:hypothetical protein [Portunus trituberculatus]